MPLLANPSSTSTIPANDFIVRIQAIHILKTVEYKEEKYRGEFNYFTSEEALSGWRGRSVRIEDAIGLEQACMQEVKIRIDWRI